jgi:ribonuclease E
MSTNDDSESGWDALADDLGVEAPKPVLPAERKEPAPRRSIVSPYSPSSESEEPETEFGAGVSEEVPRPLEPLYDLGAETVTGDMEDFDDSAPEPLEDESDESFAPSDEDEQEGGKRRRRRRRRKKKGAPASAGVEESAAEADMADEDSIVEEGEAPAEVEPDEEDERSAPASAMDEEIEEEIAQFRNEWHVMTWADLVSKLHRPG